MGAKLRAGPVKHRDGNHGRTDVVARVAFVCCVLGALTGAACGSSATSPTGAAENSSGGSSSAGVAPSPHGSNTIPNACSLVTQSTAVMISGDTGIVVTMNGRGPSPGAPITVTSSPGPAVLSACIYEDPTVHTSEVNIPMVRFFISRAPTWNGEELLQALKDGMSIGSSSFTTLMHIGDVTFSGSSDDTAVENLSQLAPGGTATLGFVRGSVFAFIDIASRVRDANSIEADEDKVINTALHML